MWVLAPHSDPATPLEEQRIQSQNLVQALQKTYLLLPDADNVLSRLPNAFSSMTSNPSSTTPRPFRPIKILEQSISGSHATLNFNRPDSIDNPDERPEVTLTDKSSYGSWVNGMRIHRTAKRLTDGDLLEFGGNRLVKFYLRYQPLVVTVSGVSDEIKASLALTVGKLGGHVVSDWRRNVSTHCCMESISVTIKTVSAMVALKPVVTPGYFDAYLTAALKDVDASTAPPDVADYLPDVSDSQLTGRNDMSFLIRPSRANVFQGKTFYFFDRKQFKKCFAVVEMGGGDPMLIEDADALKKASLDKMTQENSVVMQPNPERASQSFASSVQKALDKKQRRWIDTPEIGYAIIYSSTTLFANPTVIDPMSVWARGGSATEKRDGRGDDEDQYANNVNEGDDSSAAPAPKRQKLNDEADASSLAPTTRDDASAVAETPSTNPPAPLTDDSFVVPDTLPTQPQRDVVEPSTANSDAFSSVATAVPAVATSSVASAARPSSIFKRLLNTDSDDDDIDDDPDEEERKGKKLKMEQDEEKRREEDRKREEEVRLRKEEEEQRRKEKEQEEQQRRMKEEIQRKEEREVEERERRRREAEDKKKREDVTEEDFPEFDDAFDDNDEEMEDSPVEKKAVSTASGSVNPRRTTFEENSNGNDVERNCGSNANVKQEVTSQVADRLDGQPVSDGWIRKPTKTRGRNGVGNGLSSLSLEMMVEEVNLVVRRARVPVVAPQGNGGSGAAVPRTDSLGMPVKNFKRFKKSGRRNYQDISRMVINLVPVAMNAAPPETFQPNTLSSTASFNETGNASTFTNGSSVGSSMTTLNGSRSSMMSSASMTNGVSAVGRSTSASNGSAERHSNFDVDFGDEEIVTNGHSRAEPQQLPQQQANAAANQVPDEFFDFDF